MAKVAGTVAGMGTDRGKDGAPRLDVTYIGEQLVLLCVQCGALVHEDWGSHHLAWHDDQSRQHAWGF